jgi:hypothetical protein
MKTSTGNGFNNIATGVQSFVVDASGGIDALFVGGVLERWRGARWALLDQRVQSIWLINNGYTLDALLTNGTIRQCNCLAGPDLTAQGLTSIDSR